MALLFLLFNYIPLVLASEPSRELVLDLDPQIQQYLIDSTAHVCTPKKCGTAFFVDQGLLVTVAHTFKGDFSQKFTVYPKNDQPYTGTILNIDEKRDLALVSIPFFNHSVFEIDDREIKKGEEIYISGYFRPESIEKKIAKNPNLKYPKNIYVLNQQYEIFLYITFGEVINIKTNLRLTYSPNIKNARIYEYSLKAPTATGFSGAPVLSKDWKVIGIHISSQYDHVDRGSAVATAPHIKRLLNQYYESLKSNE